jgi:hypothetical protein
MKLASLKPNLGSSLLACSLAFGVLAPASASAQNFPLVCRGQALIQTNGSYDFNWSMAAASTTPPAPLECAFLDRAPRGSELITRKKFGKTEVGNVLVSEASKGSCSNLRDSGGFIPLAADQYIEVMVSRDPTTNLLEVHSWVGLVTPPFPAAPVEFPPLTRCTQ